MKRILLGLLLGLAIAVVLGFIIGGRDGGYARFFEYRVGFRLTNLSGKEVFVTSCHTNRVYCIGNDSAALIPHGGKGIKIEQTGGATWLYENLSPMDLAGTQYLIKRRYHIPFGGGSGTATLVLVRDGRLFAALPGATEEELSSTGQPPGFPLQPLHVSEVKPDVHQ
jgi:hypothetical protein